ncbi:MAG: DUF2244 domain-containing protein [Pseudomonadota bacterium]|nr:DUF2244 domain-containing protein [Pseudomonadota bacterium]
MNDTKANVDSAENRIFFDAILHPHRSLNPFGFKLLMATIAFMMLSIGIVFALLGAWPVIGFCGAELLLLYVMFRLNYRAGRAYERVRLNERIFEVRKYSPAGAFDAWELEPTWLLVDMDNPPEHDSQLTVTSRGRRLTIGKFLTPEERLELANALKDALNLRQRSLPFTSS